MFEPTGLEKQHENPIKQRQMEEAYLVFPAKVALHNNVFEQCQPFITWVQKDQHADGSEVASMDGGVGEQALPYVFKGVPQALEIIKKFHFLTGIHGQNQSEEAKQRIYDEIIQELGNLNRDAKRLSEAERKTLLDELNS